MSEGIASGKTTMKGKKNRDVGTGGKGKNDAACITYLLNTTGRYKEAGGRRETESPSMVSLHPTDGLVTCGRVFPSAFSEVPKAKPASAKS